MVSAAISVLLTAPIVSLAACWTGLDAGERAQGEQNGRGTRTKPSAALIHSASTYDVTVLRALSV